MTAPAALRIAVLSFAHTHALSYVHALKAMPSIELITADPDGATAPDDAPRGAALAAELGVAYVETYDEAFAWKPDAVVIAAENSRHRALVERAAAAGVHVLCEKPLATTVEDAVAMRDACDRAGVILMVAYPVRFAPGVRDAIDELRSGRLGRILGVTGINNGKLPQDRAWFTDPELAGGGALVDHVVHCADILDELLGERAQSVRAVSNSILHAQRELSVETGGLVTIQYPSGVIATIDCSWSWPMSSATWGGLTLQIVAERGTITVSPFAKGVAGHDAQGETWSPVGADLDALLLDEFVHALGAGRQPQPDASVGIRTVEIAKAAQASAARGGEVVALI
ncbi:Gfo/Idh/MocA family oxidoreductase [Microbacterium sp. KSW4-16]|uniref:Gfo/Idh/MocA family protein n=1 Tax=Microbacterium TaxID=33882 RepID=UPI00103B2C69|nr:MULTISPECIES: Gfo/Idh/MocA family oxidoreductase [Microbacterium]MCK8467553.1 Gfo/Idh/MocA family oxidoreductase [Microbacterium aurugineum]QEA28081.1 Gfo/Idh/MocA family oxidoreductase [Microbacterium sp. CBA3102]TCJ22938.1 Gfo/Idh/MocA family oxidoreductase [Microbacterium sp. PI-1]